MGRWLTFVAGIVVGVVLKWQYDQQQTPSGPVAATAPTGASAAAPSLKTADVQVIPITVEEPSRPSVAPPNPEGA